jgi:hypothetical protein
MNLSNQSNLRIYFQSCGSAGISLNMFRKIELASSGSFFAEVRKNKHATREREDYNTAADIHKLDKSPRHVLC